MIKEVNISQIRPHTKNSYFFDDITGDNWDAFLESIRTSGVIEPIVIDGKTNIIISGHQRVRACEEIGIENILCDVREYDDEDKILKDLIETNIRQRGIGNPNAVKMGRCLVELERIYGIQRGNNQRTATLLESSKTQEDIMNELSLNKESYRNYKKLTTLIPELQDLVQEEAISPSVASRILSKLTDEEQQKLLSSLPSFEKLTQKKAEELIKSIKPEVVEKVVDKTDYATINKLKAELGKLNSDNETLNMNIRHLTKDKDLLEKRSQLNKEDAEKYNQLKKQIEYLNTQKDNLSRDIGSITSISTLVVDIERMLQDKLAPVKYSRAVQEQLKNETVINNILEIVDRVNGWCDEMYRLVKNNNNMMIIKENDING